MVEQVYSVEEDLYPHIQTWLEGPLSVARIDASAFKFGLTKDTSNLNWAENDLGSWMRPDLAHLRIIRRHYSATTEVGLFAIEVKKTVPSLVEGLFQALAYTEIADFSYLCAPSSAVWNSRILRTAKRFGVGLVKFDDARDWTTYEVLSQSKVFDPNSTLKKRYLDGAFGLTTEQSSIRAALKGGL